MGDARDPRDICREFTDLAEADIALIEQVAAHLQMIADLAQANVFIDCPTKDRKHAIVVAEASPRTAPSLYSRSVVGQFAYESYEPAVIRTHKTGKPTIENRAITQEGKSVKQSVVPIQNAHGETIGSLIMEQDITTQVIHEKQLSSLNQTVEELSKTLIGLTKQESFILDMIQESMFLVDKEGCIVYANAHGINLMVEMGGAGNFVGTPLVRWLPFLAPIDFQKEDVLFKEINVKKKVFAVKGILLRNVNRPYGYLLLIRDLTELRDKERQLMVKSMVIKEIHHRVKNNLQTVASLLRLQMRRGVPPEAEQLFQASLNRILSIASVHDILSNTGIDDIEIVQMVEKIGQMLVQNNGWPEKKIDIFFEGKPFLLKSHRAVPLALVVNELIQNSLEHAFVTRQAGTIEVIVTRERETVQVIIRDDGVGFSAGEIKESLGLQIVRTLTEHDLAGTFAVKSTAHGTEAVIRFPAEEVE